MRLYLARHGETEWTVARRHTGRTDLPLTPTGERQARALGLQLAGVSFDRVLSSPLDRALTTAHLAGFGDRVEPSDALLEMDYGQYEGLTTPEIRARRQGWDLFRDGCPGGETVEDVAKRVRPLLELLAHGDGNALLFGHGHNLRVLAATFLGLEPATARHLALDTGSISVLGYEHEWPAILRWNLTGRAPWPGGPGDREGLVIPELDIQDAEARAAAVAAARRHIEPGMTIGLGSGRAVLALVDALAGRWQGGPPIRVAAASAVTESRARAAGMELIELDAGVTLDLAIDGADEVDPQLNLIKGGGAALLREKFVFAAARRVLIIAEQRKRVQRLGSTHPLPVEVVRFAWPTTRRRLLDLVPEAVMRHDPSGAPLRTDEGHYLLDCQMPEAGPDGLATLAAALKATLGVVDHGLFLGVADEVLLGNADGTVETLRRQP
jgi:ribose 5-phosphate isomerase